MNTTRGHRSSVLEYWWMLELFNPQSIPKPTPRATRPPNQQVICWSPGDELPWDRLPNPGRGADGTPRTWRHTVYLGVYLLEETYDVLHRAFAEDPDAGDERPGGRSACAGVLIDGAGCPIPSSAILSSAAWAVGRVQHPGPWTPERLIGFDTAQAAFLDAVDRFEGGRRDATGADAPVPADARAVTDLVALAHLCGGIAGLPRIATSEVVISSVVVGAEKSEEIDFLNSFFLHDLSTVRDHVRAGDIGAGLERYLTGDDSLPLKGRIDVVDGAAGVAAADAGVAIGRLPLGRWPSNPNHPLALSQQLAVNLALNDLAPATGLLGVNGPPGTGKTTMLRDVLAGNVVERARRLAALKSPYDAFTGEPLEVKTSSFLHRFRRLRPELTGFEMVVASSNNSAVENVTTEIPAREAIASPWRESADYFSAIATEVLRGTSKAADSQAAWGLVAARLGNKTNRGAFHTAFWFGADERRAKDTARGPIPGMLERLKRWRTGADSPRPWSLARSDFAAAEKRVTDLIAVRRAAAERRDRLAQESSKVPEAEDHARRLRELVARAEHGLGEQRRTVEQLRNAVARADADYTRHAQRKPGTIENLFSLGKAMESWRAEEEPLVRNLNGLLGAFRAGEERAQQIANELHRRKSDGAAADGLLDTMLRSIDALEAECALDRKRYGDAYPKPLPTVDPPKALSDNREMRAPWLDTDLDTARSELFLAALRLHEDFLANTAKEMVGSLSAACAVMAKGLPHNVEDREVKARAAWQLLFLVVPMVSTTFASVGRMFSDLGQESIGWLLIDEAGQASPQHAVGAIWRARRVVAVGDPLQLQPVVTMPPKAQRDIATAYGVSETWIPPRASVQTLADRVAIYGTTISQGEKPVWVSAPLRVHRRCDNPMFDLCNRIAYGDIMVNGVHRKPHTPDDPDRYQEHDSNERLVIAPSMWAHEPATAPGTHLQTNQIAKLEEILMRLEERGVPPDQVIAISPFRAVADRLSALSADYPGLSAGTIHTAQGREAPVVILVLGGDPAREGAKAWAASSVNLVNVAASRAQRRLYVIGDRDAWQRHNYFQQLSAALR